jgi:hypothetical protein
MKKFALAAGVVAVASVGLAVPAQAAQPSCNWGQLTSGAIGGGFAQGPHSSDPSGDGHGPGTADEPRSGLANVLTRGDLHATCEFIAGALP